jgi:hypothetical protein
MGNRKENNMNYTAAAWTQPQDSAREWQKLQMGVLGFVGLCGVLRGGDAATARPLWLQDLSGIASLAGLVFAILAVTMVATVAHPLSPRPITTDAAGRRLSRGIVITFVAAGLTALSAVSMWWPEGTDKRPVEPSNQMVVTTSSGSACGTVVGSASGSLGLQVDGQHVNVPLNRLVSIKLVNNC